jgi:NAD(P)-dependent dehydrogenase (short-subunit alcohol dehydrogenase family)
MRVSPFRVRFDTFAVYILVGGLGGLGRSILQWMVDHGARRVVIFNRSGKAPDEASPLLCDLSKCNILVHVVKCDIIDKEQVVSAMHVAMQHGQIKGILHAAVVLEDRVFATLAFAQWKHGLSAKVYGALNLHNAAESMQLELDFFVMTSSFMAVMALPTTAAYCAANCFQDAFARYRRSKGLPGCAIAFGLITEIGVMGQRSGTRKMLNRHGLYDTGELGFLRLLEGAFLDPP